VYFCNNFVCQALYFDLDIEFVDDIVEPKMPGLTSAAVSTSSKTSLRWGQLGYMQNRWDRVAEEKKVFRNVRTLAQWEEAAGHDVKVMGAVEYWIGQLKKFNLLSRASGEEFVYQPVTLGQFIKILNHGREDPHDLTDLDLTSDAVLRGKKEMVSAVRVKVQNALKSAHPAKNALKSAHPAKKRKHNPSSE